MVFIAPTPARAPIEWGEPEESHGEYSVLDRTKTWDILLTRLPFGWEWHVGYSTDEGFSGVEKTSWAPTRKSALAKAKGWAERHSFDTKVRYERMR